MPDIKRSALMPYPAAFMYSVVNDVEAYPEFLPWCGGAKIHARDAEFMDASIRIQRAGFERWFRTRNRMTEGESIEISLVDGPFENLEGRWRFVPLGEEACRVELELHFRMKAGIGSAIMATAFTRIADTMVDSFCERARQLEQRQNPD